MTSGPSMTELRRGVLGPCVLALLERRPRFGLELVRDLSAADGLLTSDGTVYPLLNRLRDAGLVTTAWREEAGERARRYYSITDAGRESLTAFRAEWTRFAGTVGAVLLPDEQTRGTVGLARGGTLRASAPRGGTLAASLSGRGKDAGL